MRVHNHHPIHEAIKSENLIEEEIEQYSSDKGKPPASHPIYQNESRTHAAEHAAQNALATQIEQHRSRIEKQDSLNRKKSRNDSFRFTHIEQLSALLEGHSDQEQAEREGRLTRILEAKSESDWLDEILEAAENDPASAYASLTLMALRLKDGHSPGILARIQRSLEALQSQYGKEISAGVNTANAIASYSTDPTQKKILRKLYYQGVVGQQSSDSVLDMLLSKFGVDGFIPALRTLQRALADDIASLSPSISPAALRRLLSGLNDTRIISNTIQEVTEFLERITRTFGKVSVSRDAMTRTLLGMCRNGFYSNSLLKLGIETIGEVSQREPFFFNHLLRLIQRLPENVWGDNGKHRQTAIHMLRTLNGELAAREKSRMRFSL